MNSTSDTYDPAVVSDIVTRTAERLGVEPTDLEPLATTIDPELVTAFAAADATKGDSQLQFRYSGCDVRVTGSGEVAVGRTTVPAEEE